jgi:hypothetical protein
MEKDAGYSLIFAPPSPDSQVEIHRLGLDFVWSAKVDMSQLAIKWVCVCALTGVAWFFLPESKRVDRPSAC